VMLDYPSMLDTILAGSLDLHILLMRMGSSELGDLRRLAT